MPVPVRTTDGETVALLVTVRVPMALPAAVGANVAERERVCDGVRVVVPLKPLTENPTPVELTWEMVTLPVPLLVIETGCELALPTAVEGNVRLLTLGESRYVAEAAAAALPVPETDTV